MKTAITGSHSETATSQILQKSGVSKGTANLIDNGISTYGMVKGSAVVLSTQAAYVPRFHLHPKGTPNINLNRFHQAAEKLAKASPESWTSSLNPFKGKSFEEIDLLFQARGFETKGPNPLQGKGSYFSPTTGRKYYFDHAGKKYKGEVIELPHVDVHYNTPVGNLQKQ